MSASIWSASLSYRQPSAHAPVRRPGSFAGPADRACLLPVAPLLDVGLAGDGLPLIGARHRGGGFVVWTEGPELLERGRGRHGDPGLQAGDLHGPFPGVPLPAGRAG